MTGVTCRSCGKMITWVYTKNGDSMPVNGEICDEYFDHTKHESHFATCPQASKWRKTDREYRRKKKKALALISQACQDLYSQGYKKSHIQSISKALTGCENGGQLQFAKLAVLEDLLLPCLQSIKGYVIKDEIHRLYTIESITARYTPKLKLKKYQPNQRS